MKSFLIAVGLCAALLGCGSSPNPEGSSTSAGGSSDYNYDSPGSSYVGECDRPSYQKLVVNGQTVIVEIPTLCNKGPDPYHGDPCPDCGDPNPEDKYSNPGDKSINPSSLKERVNTEHQNIR